MGMGDVPAVAGSCLGMERPERELMDSMRESPPGEWTWWSCCCCCWETCLDRTAPTLPLGLRVAQEDVS